MTPLDWSMQSEHLWTSLYGLLPRLSEGRGKGVGRSSTIWTAPLDLGTCESLRPVEPISPDDIVVSLLAGLVKGSIRHMMPEGIRRSAGTVICEACF